MKQTFMQCIQILCLWQIKKTFVDVPHDSSVVYRTRHHEVSISGPADVIHILYVSPANKSNDKSATELYNVQEIQHCRKKIWHSFENKKQNPLKIFPWPEKIHLTVLWFTCVSGYDDYCVCVCLSLHCQLSSKVNARKRCVRDSVLVGIKTTSVTRTGRLLFLCTLESWLQTSSPCWAEHLHPPETQGPVLAPYCRWASTVELLHLYQTTQHPCIFKSLFKMYTGQS